MKYKIVYADPGWNQAAMMFAHEGFARTFDEVYSPSATVGFMEYELFGREE